MPTMFEPTLKPKRSWWQRLKTWLAGDAEHARRVEERIKMALNEHEPPNGLERRKSKR